MLQFGEWGISLKHKIAIKLFIYFLVSLLLSATITGVIFSVLIRQHTTTLYKNDLKARAITMSRIISRISNDDLNDANSLDAIKNLREVALADVWIVNKDLEVITIQGFGIPHFKNSPNQKKPNQNRKLKHKLPPLNQPPPPLPSQIEKLDATKTLPQKVQEVIKKAFSGETVVSSDFNPMLEHKSITVGTPIFNKDKSISFVLLLHSPERGLRNAIHNSIKLFVVSILIAIIIAAVAGIILSISFTKPLKKMNDAVQQMGNGNYNTHTGVYQKNELGELARTLDVLADRLKYAADESAQLEKSRQNFLTNISHELRTPVTVIRGSLEALCDGVVTEQNQVQEYHNQMLMETKHLHSLVNDLLELSRLQAVDFKIEKKPFDITCALNDAVRAIKKTKEGKNTNIVLKKESSPKEQVGDYSRVRELFLIILDNAIKFSVDALPHSEVNIVVQEHSISITDNGIGIPRELLPHIFERFYTTKSFNNKDGTGLGLAIAKEIAERHGYSINVQSPVVYEDSKKNNANGGACFTIAF